VTPPALGRRDRRSRALGAVVLAFAVAGARLAFAADVAALREEGAAHYQARRYFQAIEVFEQALTRAGAEEADAVRHDLARALAGLGMEYLHESESKLAEATFRRALEQTDDWFANFGLGYLYFLRRADGDALTFLLESLRARGDYAPTHKLIALLTYRKGETNRALERLEEAARLDPKDGESRVLVERWTTELAVLGGFASARTEHFELRVDPRLPPALRARLEQELEAAYHRIGSALGSWPERPTPVVAFSPGRFRQATGSDHWVGGLYDGQLKLPVDEDVLDDPERLDELVRVVRHEFAHVVVRGLAPECPAWFHEGLAQYLEGRGARDAIYRRLASGADERVPLRRMPAQLADLDDVELTRWIYLQSLGFVEFLAERYKPFRLRLFLAALTEERSASRAFERTYGASIEDLEKRWWEAIDAVGREAGGDR